MRIMVWRGGALVASRCTPSSFTNALAKSPENTSRMAEGAADVLVSVITPVFNSEPFLDEMFASVCVQTHRRLEVRASTKFRELLAAMR